FGEDEVFDFSIPSTLDPEPTEKRFPPLSKSFVKAGEMHDVLPSITGTFMPTSYKSDLIETQVAHHSADQPNPACWSKRPAPVSAGWFNPVARPYLRPSSAYFNNLYWPKIYDSMYMNEGRWGTAVKPSADNDLGIVDSGCSRSMTGNKEMLDDFVQVKGGIVKFRGGDDTDCLVLTEEFPLPDESQMAHVNFKTINKLAKEGLVDGLPLKVFTNEHNYVACNKGKQHKSSYKPISTFRLVSESLQLLHMDLFGPTNIRSIDQKYYSLVVTDDFTRFS
nr:ribonuclease H-like domain-containing protein [Tanacetum cinerariifolium]